MSRIKECGLPVSSVVDVGVRECTAELKAAFPSLHHYLFEPVSGFFPAIERNYRDVGHQIFEIALSDVNTTSYLVSSALEGDGVTTHSNIRPEPQVVDGARITGCDEIHVRRFDTLDLDVGSDFLLKGDVDGQDLNVLKGFGTDLKRASVVMVEVTYASVIQRLNFLSESGFHMIDFVDLVYYGAALYQFDAVFVRTDLVDKQLRPPISQFDANLWRPLVV